MKKIVFLIAVFLVAGLVAFADGGGSSINGVSIPLTKQPVERLVPGELNITVNGKVIYFVHKTYALDGTTFADGKKLFSEFGYETDFNKSQGILTASKNGKTITFIQGKDRVVVNDGVLYVPVRAVSEALGYTVGWDGAQYLVTIAGELND